MSFDFEELDVWNLAVEYSAHVYTFTKSLPEDERFGLIPQLRRASISISSNIAEGAGRRSNKEFKRFLRIAKGSLYETVSLLRICSRLSYLDQDDHQRLYELANRVGCIINGLHRSIDD